MGRIDIKKHIELADKLVWIFKCPKCGKTIESLYKDQVMQQAAQHLQTHKSEKKAEKKKK